MPHARRAALAALALVLVSPAVLAQEATPPPTPEQLAAQERVRPLVGAVWQDVRSPVSDKEAPQPRYFWKITDQLIAIGPDVVPFLAAELDLMDPATFHFTAYALGVLGGDQAEAALRKAIRVAEANGGRFGAACRRFALFSLALMGEADVVDLMQQGNPPLHGAVMLPDFPLHAHLALLIGRDAAPLLVKQLDTYRADPEAIDKLEDALIALGRAGDPSAVPKILPFLSHGSSKIRGIAADTVSRLADPPVCEQLIPLFANKETGERLLVAMALERWKPQPCYKAIVGRLEVEEDVGVRLSLYSAVVAMGGESALEVLRPYVGTKNQFDQALVVDAIGRVGSKKGLNLLRALLPDANPNTVAHALGAIARIGGESAIDTLLATTSDRRPFVASAAAEILTHLKDERVAPRRAGELIALVKEPIGNLNLRSRVVELTEALVTLRYIEPIDDLKTALAVQTDPEIVESLTSCIRRLEILKKNGNDDALWAAELASPILTVRELATLRLAELSTPGALKALTARLGRNDLDPEERAHTLEAIGDARTGGAESVIERHLADTMFDAWELRDARAAAAYAARQLGGARMSAALRASALRRDGRDWATLVYWAILDKGATVDTLRTLRLRRMRYPESRFGREDGQLAQIITDLSASHSIAPFDLTPHELFDK